MMAAMIELFCDSFADVPGRSLPSGRRSRTPWVLDIDDTEDRVHGHQQLSLFHAHGACPSAAQGPTGGTAAASCRSTSVRPPQASRWR
jgi:hypothetical protein